MKSSINSLTDYKSIPVKTEILIFPLSEDEIERKVHALSRKRKQVIHPDVIQKGDVVTLNLESLNPRFNKKMLPVTVGIGLYDKNLESQLIGLQNGENKVFLIGDREVAVSILSVTRTIFPEPTKEEVQSFALSMNPPQNFTTAAEYIDFLQNEYKKEQRESAVYETMQEIIDEVLTTSNWEFDEAEVDEQYNLSIQELDEQSRHDLNKSYMELTDDDIKANSGLENRTELEKALRSDAENLIASALFFGHIKGIRPQDINLSDEDIMDFSVLEDYVRSIITCKDV